MKTVCISTHIPYCHAGVPHLQPEKPTYNYSHCQQLYAYTHITQITSDSIMHCHVKYIDVCEKSATFGYSLGKCTVCRRVHILIWRMVLLYGIANRKQSKVVCAGHRIIPDMSSSF